jgi:hypothetical protein
MVLVCAVLRIGFDAVYNSVNYGGEKVILERVQRDFQ